MIKLIQEITAIIGDYRKEEGFGISEERVEQWIRQFDPNDQVFLLEELKNIFEKRYFSKKRTKQLLLSLLKKLKELWNYPSEKDMLAETTFLNLQGESKSQSDLLKLLNEVLKENYNCELENCGNKSLKNYIYIDDLLCTGTTFYRDIEKWLAHNNQLHLLNNNQIRLAAFFIGVLEKGYKKKLTQLCHRFNQSNIKILPIWLCQIDCEYAWPLNQDQPTLVTDYENQITEEVNKHTKTQGNYISPSEFYRQPSFTAEEKFFSSPQNRQRFENILLTKGIEILGRTESIAIKQMRALGYGLPSHKNFGTGALFFTWRNIANNTPLVFWYSGGGFSPLFEKKQKSDLFLNF